jgi:D-alanyl-lipoteichoic acid acyltransferase DltB (MBOAT superfamily)
MTLVLPDLHLIPGITIAALFTAVVLLLPGIGRTSYLCLLSVLAAFAFFRAELLGYAVVNGSAYLFARWVSRSKSVAVRWRWACVAMIAVVAVFTAGRLGHWDHPWKLDGSHSVILFSLGMWPTLKLVSLFWEIGSGSMAVLSLPHYVLWTCLPFTLGGPLLRPSQMPAQLLVDRRALLTVSWWQEAGVATAKLVVGSYLGIGHHFLTVHWPQAHYFNNAVATFVSGPLGFYLTTAGYFQCMEILGRPAGFKLPPSFNYPIGRENISAFWMNWNMTATYVFRDYLFYNRWGRQTYNMYFNTLLLFTLVGVWHAANAYWILWGFLHGVLFTTFLLWRRFRPRMTGIPLPGPRVSKTAARVLTYFSVCMCWYLPSKILQKLGAI